jgi:hypothetical protein
MVTALKQAKNGDRNTVMENYQNKTGKSIQTLYRIAGQNGYRTKRRRRCDSGTCALNENQIKFVASLINASKREIKGPIMDVGTALSIAEDNHIIEPGTVSVSWMQTLLREREIHRAALKTPRPSSRMRSRHPNHVHVMDSSVCIQYYLKGKKGLRIMREDMFYKNKLENYAKVKDRLMRYILADHFSHTLYVKYYYSGGESQENLYDFLLAAWSGGKHEKFPFRGVPFYMLWDKASANVSLAIREFMQRLDIEKPPSLPHNPRRQGSAEVAQNIVEGKFESRLKFQPAYSVEELNEWALDWCVWFNATARHRRHGMTRTECWITIKQMELRELPEREMLHYLFANPDAERLVKSDYTISFAYKNHGSQDYFIKHIPGVIPNRSKVKVILRPHHWPEIGVIFDGNEYLVKPMETVAGGFGAHSAVIGEEYKAMPESVTQQAVKQMDNLAYGEDPVKDAVPFAGITVFGHQAGKVDTTYIPRRGAVLNVSGAGAVLDKEIPVMTLFSRLRKKMGTVPPALNRAVRETYGTSITISEADRLLNLAGAGNLTAENIGSGITDQGLRAEGSHG